MVQWSPPRSSSSSSQSHGIETPRPARARAGLGVSIPCDWVELDGLTGGDHWTIANAHERLEAAADPWADYARCRQALGAARKALRRAVAA